MANKAEQFQSDIEVKAFDQQHRKTINNNIGKYNNAVAGALPKFYHLENSKRRAHTVKWKAIENMDRYLLEFEQNFTRRGGKVVWANDAAEANHEILNILRKHSAKMVVKSKSMVTEEIQLNESLIHHQIESVETDLGEYIVQLLGQKPYHIVTPAMHLSKNEIAKLFHEKFGSPIDASPEQITEVARGIMREKFVKADIGITGANFLIADTGSICVTENEGNARLSMSFPKVHIAIAGIEKILPNMADLDLFWPLLASHGTGQNLTVYNSLINGPKQETEIDGPEEMYVILLDNGRTNLLAQKEQRESLYCIRCGACLNACPVYKNIGGHSYETTYSGPIGSVITPYMREMSDFKHLSFASSLCGACTEVCPVKIEIHKMLLVNRRDSIDKNLASRPEMWGWFFFKRFMLSRKLLDLTKGPFKNFVLKRLFSLDWAKRRVLPDVAPQSFSEQYIKSQKNT
jgi:L-lactate dehydrogenase complex protein LldF